MKTSKARAGSQEPGRNPDPDVDPCEGLVADAPRPGGISASPGTVGLEPAHGLVRLAIGLAWGLDAEAEDNPVIFWWSQSPEYRGVLLSAATVLQEKMVAFRAASVDVAARPATFSSAIVAVAATVGELEVFRHDPGPCRHCGHVYENGCCAIPSCPACGCPTEPPDNASGAT